LNVELLTLSQVTEITGSAGDFSIEIRQQPRYIDMNKCIACGLCAEKCPRKTDDEFNMGVGKRKAVYIKYGQAVPLKYAIDAQNCIYLTRGKCRACEKFCPTGAINFDDKEKIIARNVGAVILAPGFHPYDPSGIDFYGYGKIPDVVTSMEYERMLSASGPSQGHLIRPSDHTEPQKIAWIQCVGSRNTNRCDNGYCSSVCCMYAIKQALVTAEHLSGGNPEPAIFNMDIRSHGKEFERYYETARETGVKFVRARPHTVDPGPGNSGVRLVYTDEAGRQERENFDLAVLSIGLEAPEEVKSLAQTAGIKLNRYGFAETSGFEPVATNRPGIFVTGAFQGPKDIPQSVTEASTAAAEAARLLVNARGTLTREKTYPAERDTTAEKPVIGVFVCSCGINIANTVDVNELVNYAETLPDVVFVENNLFTCSADTQNLIAEKIKEYGLNRIVVAACTPRTHEPLFQDTLREAGLNPYLIEMANIRNQNAWVHQKEPEKATAKAKDQVCMAVARVHCNYPLQQLNVTVNRQALVIGGGAAGMNAALTLADQGRPCILIEKSEILGGQARYLLTNDDGEPVRPVLNNLIEQVETHENITVMKSAVLETVDGAVGNFVSRVKTDGVVHTVRYGAAVIATGAREYQPQEYLYGQHERVQTLMQFDVKLAEESAVVQNARSIVFIQCVGSREPERPYCSRVCCTHAVKNAIELKEMNPAMNVYILNRDLRTYGLREDLYRTARELGVIFIRFTPQAKPQVTATDGKLYIDIFDPISRLPLKIYADYLVLAAAVIPNDNRKLIELYKCGVNADGFLNEAHPKLRPVDMSVEGLFVAGLCNYPKPLDESIAQARAAASRAGVVLAKEKMQLDAIKSCRTDHCDGCALCVDVCPFKAITIEAYQADDGAMKKRIVTEPTLCKGCGLCEAVCPKEGVFVHGFTQPQIKAQVDAILETPTA